MTAQFSYGNGSLWLGDCLDLMRHIPDGSVDMVITSPPYDDLRTYNGSLTDWTFDKFCEIARELSRVIKTGGAIVWNVADATVKGSETGSSFRQALYFKDDCGLNLHDTMIFNKKTRQAVGSHYSYWQSFEYMFVLSKGKPTFNAIKDVPNKYAGYITRSGTRDKDGNLNYRKSRVIDEFSKRSNVWEYLTGNNNGDDKIGHPAPFPIRLANDHIASWSNPGDLVLDPFAGSCTTAIAAQRTGRRWLCIERELRYYLASAGRIWGECQI